MLDDYLIIDSLPGLLAADLPAAGMTPEQANREAQVISLKYQQPGRMPTALSQSLFSYLWFSLRRYL